MSSESIKSAGRRYVTALFSDVSGSSQHAERMEAEDYAGLLEQFRQQARKIIAQFGGEIARLQGDGLLALFGHQQTGESDGRRAVEAALALHEAIGALPVPQSAGVKRLQLHSGIHAGLALVIEGDIERGRLDVVGEVPNTASRLCHLAAPGEIWVSELSLGPHAHFFEATRMRRMVIRGRLAPLNALRIVGRSSVELRLQAAARRGAVALAGRQQELDRLAKAANDSLHSGSAPWILAGEPGIGKSRLIAALKSRLEAAGYWVIAGSYESARATQPLHAFASGLRALFGAGLAGEGSDTASSAIGLLQGLGAGADNPLHQQLIRKAQSAEPLDGSEIVDIIRLVARHGPTALLLDDWQWADDASHQVLQRLAQGAEPLFVLQGMRTPLPEPDRHHSQLMLLPALDTDAVAQLVASWMPGGGPFVAAEVERLAGGNPLFIEELCHAVRVGSPLPTQRPGASIAWLDSMIASRLAMLQPDELDCLQIAAIADHSATLELLDHLSESGGPATASRVESLIGKDFLVPPSPGVAHGAMRFRHALTREAVYATVDAPRRRELHRRVADDLESGAHDETRSDRLDALASHYHAARVPAKAAHYAEAAGDRALALLATDRAREHYTTALEALDDLGLDSDAQRRRWCLVAQKLGNSCVFDPLSVRERMPLFRQAIKLAHELHDDDLVARAEYWMGYVEYGRGQPASAIRHCEAAHYAAQASGEPKLIAQIQATLGQALAQGGNYERASPLLEQAVGSKRQHSRAGSRAAIGSAYTLSRMAFVQGDLGRFTEAHALFDQSLELMGHELHSVGASIYTTVGAVHLWQGNWEAAAEAEQRGIDIALRCRSHYLVAIGRGLLGCALWAGTGNESVLDDLQRTCRDIETAGGAAWMSLVYGWLVQGYCARGDLSEARSEAAHLLRRARLEDQHGLAMGYRALARRALQDQAPELAARHLARAEAAAERRRSPRESQLNALVRSQWLAAQGRPQEAAATELAAHEGLRRMGMLLSAAQCSQPHLALAA